MKNELLLRIEKNTISNDELRNFYEEIGWGIRSDYEQLSTISFSEHCIYYSLYNDIELIGIAKVLTDTFSFTLLLELAIRPQFQKMGYGAFLLQYIEKNISTKHLFVHSLLTTEAYFATKHYNHTSKYQLLLKKVP